MKRLLGGLPSLVVNWMLKRQTSHAKNAAWIDYVNDRPNWFAHVERRFLTKTKFGFSIWCDRWDNIGQTIIKSGEWEPLLSRTILAWLKPGDIAIDVGANMGYDTMLMSTAVGKAGTVIAFEPDLQNLALLVQNLEQLRDGNVVVQSVALSDAPNMLRMSVAGKDNRGLSNLRRHEAGPSQPVLATRMDAVLGGSLGDKRIRMVKMDVEGFEHKVILGMGRLIDQVDCLTCEINREFLIQCGTSAESLFQTLRDHGFKSYCSDISDDAWAESDHKYKSKGGQHFDALFCRESDPELNTLPLLH